MIYFLVNNNYHIQDLKRYFNKSILDSSTFISIPVNLNISHIPGKVIEFPVFSFRESIRNIFEGLSKIKKINKNINPLENDVLIVFSEIELSNQVVIEKFFNSRCKIYLIEDGTATPVLFNLNLDKKDVVSITIKFILKNIFGFKYIRVCHEGENYMFYHMSDKIFNGVILFSDYEIKRNIKKYIIKEIESVHRFPSNTNNCVFFYQHLHKAYLSFDEFLVIIVEITSRLSSSFETVYFKFHPNEQVYYIDKIKLILSDFKNVIIFEDKHNESILNLNISYGVSFTSTALREFEYYGLKPIYLFNLYPMSLSINMHEKFTNYLICRGYVFLESLDCLDTYLNKNVFFKDKIQSNVEIFNIESYH